MEGNVSIPKTVLAGLMKTRAHMDLLDVLGVDNWGGYEGLGEDAENNIDRQVAAMPCIDNDPTHYLRIPAPPAGDE